MIYRQQKQPSEGVMISAGAILVASMSLVVLNTPTSSDSICVARNMYWEAAIAGQPIDGLRGVAYVTLGRAADNRADWGGNTLCGVVYHTARTRSKSVAQFSWVLGRYARTHATNRLWAWLKALQIAQEAARGELSQDPRYAEARYYMNPEASSVAGRCWIESNFVEIGRIASHVFFREPTPEEKAARWQLSAVCAALAAKPQKIRVAHLHTRHAALASR